MTWINLKDLKNNQKSFCPIESIESIANDLFEMSLFRFYFNENNFCIFGQQEIWIVAEQGITVW